MGLLDFNTKQRGTQMLIKDNGNIVFRQLEIEQASLIEKKNNQIVRGWRHFHKSQYPFDGYKNIHPGAVTISHERDVVYDPHGILNDEEKPEKITALNSGFNRRGIKEIAQETLYRLQNLKKPNTLQNRLTWVLLIIALVWGLSLAFRLVH